MTSQTDFIGTVFIADPTNSTQQMKVNADGSINAVVSSFGTASAGNGLVVTGGAIGISPTTGPATQENRVINGDFLLDQYHEFASFTPLTSAYGPDRWTWGVGVASAFTAQSLTAAPPPDLSDYLTITVATPNTPAAGAKNSIRQSVEGINAADLQFGTAGAKSVVLSFWAKASVTGSYAVGLKNASSARSYIVLYAVSSANTWAQYSFIIPGDTSGTWLYTTGAAGIILTFDLGGGTNAQTTPNAWQAGNFTTTSAAVQLVTNAAATLSISNIRLYAGTYIVPYSPRSFGTEFSLAQRYYRKSFPPGTAPAQSAGVAGAICVKNPIALGDPSTYVAFSPTMMATPSITTFNPSAANANWRDVTAASDVTVSVDPASALGPGGVLFATSGTITTLGDVLAIHYTAQSEL